MRKSTALKTLLRSPAKTLLTFLLIAAASFALFSRVTDYAVTTRESAKAESFYYGVAALDNSTPPIDYYYPEPKPWPSDAQIEEFSSLPGVTLADTRYMTDGLIEDYKRIIDEDSSYETAEFVLEGTYEGYKDYEYGDVGSYIKRYLNFSDIKVLAGDVKVDPRHPLQVVASFWPEAVSHYKQPFSTSFFDRLKKGSRFLVLGDYSERTGAALELNFYYYTPEECLHVIDGPGDNYLETEEFAWYKDKIEALNQSFRTFDMVYTSDMRAIPYVNEHKLVISEGRPLTAGDTQGCVVSEAFLQAYGLSVGDKLNIELGDKLRSRYGEGGTRVMEKEELPDHFTPVELEIIGSYRFTNDGMERYTNENSWSFGPSSIFVPSSLLPLEVPGDHEILMGDFSVFIENPYDIEAFREAAEPLAGEMSIGLRLSDGGWSGMKDNFKTGSLASFLTTMLYVLGAALALLLAVYLYIGRSKKSYAIMRTLGVSSRRAASSLTLPFGALSAVAMAAGGIAGLYYASYTAAKTLAGMSDSAAPEGYSYVLDAALPLGVVIICLLCELLFISLVTLVFLQKMKKMSPLELLQEGAAKRTGILQNSFAPAGHMMQAADTAPVPQGLDMAKLSGVLGTADVPGAKQGTRNPAYGKYNAIRQVGAYILRHMKRGFGKTAVSFVLTVVLAAGLGMFVLARLSYQETARETGVKGRAMMFTSDKVVEMSNSGLLSDIYYYSKFSVRVNGVGVLSPVTFTNDFDRYLIDGYTVDYLEGYDVSVFEGTGPVCLVGQTLAEELGVKLGEEITLISEDLYSFMPQIYAEEELEFAIARAGKPYKVVGILKSQDKDINAGIFGAINQSSENLYSQPFSVDYCEFTLADNGKLAELESLMEEWRNKSIQYSPMASYHVDSEALENARRIRDLLESLFPIAVAAAVLIGLFGPGLVLLQSAQEAASLRILGVTKKRARCMLVFEQLVLSIAGIVLVAGVLALFCPGLFAKGAETLVFCWALYFLGCICGALTAAVEVTRRKALELMQVKE